MFVLSYLDGDEQEPKARLVLVLAPGCSLLCESVEGTPFMQIPDCKCKG